MIKESYCSVFVCLFLFLFCSVLFCFLDNQNRISGRAMSI